MKKIILLLFISYNISAQSIINTESNTANNDKKVFAEIEAAFDMQQGNTEILQLEASVLLGYNLTDKNLIKLSAGHAQLTEDKESIDNDSYVQLRHNYKFSELIKSFAFIQYQENLNLLLTERLILGIGLRYDFSVKGFNFGVGSGLMYENEVLFEEKLKLYEQSDFITIRMCALSTFSFSISEFITIHNTTFFQPDVTNFFFDFRLLNDLSIITEFNDYFSLENKIIFRHDSDPPSALKEDDLAFVAGVIFSF
jgi:putative salt-induced outer membrane protein YdiY